MSHEPPFDWSSLFSELFERSTPATEIALGSVLAPLTQDEIAAIEAELTNPWPADSPYFATYKPLDPSRWSLPKHPIPASYVQFLKWSDGAAWQTGEREFACFGSRDLRDYMLRYHFPEYMPGALPIGLDGGGLFGVFDLRTASSDAVWAIGSGALCWEDAVLVADSFVEFCQGTTSVGDVYDEARQRGA